MWNEDKYRAYFSEVYDPGRLKSALQDLNALLPPFLSGSQHFGANPIPFDLEILNTNERDFKKLAEAYLQYSTKLHSPKYMGHQVSPPMPLAAVSSAIVGLTNQSLAIAELGPFATAIEKKVIEKLASKIGWTNDYGGIATSGGTLANLTAISAARNEKYAQAWEEGLPQNNTGVIIASADAHYCIARAAGVLGIGTNNVLEANVDHTGKIDINSLKTLMEDTTNKGLDIICLVASAPSTPRGAIDPISHMADLAQQYGVWLHVDAVHGASGLFSKAHKTQLNGIDRADSTAWDAHKMMHVPSLSTYLLFREKKKSFQAFKVRASYLFGDEHQESLETDGAHRTFECTKSASSVPVWFAMNLYGDGIFEKIVDYCYGITQKFYDMLDEADDFRPLHKPMTNILAFQFTPETCPSHQLSDLQRNIRRELLTDSEYYISAVTIAEHHCLRVTLINPQTRVADLDGLVDKIRLIYEKMRENL